MYLLCKHLELHVACDMYTLCTHIVFTLHIFIYIAYTQNSHYIHFANMLHTHCKHLELHIACDMYTLCKHVAYTLLTRRIRIVYTLHVTVIHAAHTYTHMYAHIDMYTYTHITLHCRIQLNHLHRPLGICRVVYRQVLDQITLCLWLSATNCFCCFCCLLYY